MGWFSEDIETMEHLFVHGLQDIYYAERQIEKALPDMIEKASDAELKRGFKMHLRQTKGQIKRLEQCLQEDEAHDPGHQMPGDRRHPGRSQRDRGRCRRQDSC